MENLFEQSMHLETSEAFAQILKAQAETYGLHEIRRLVDIIKRNRITSVLDIGAGEGSFLCGLARELPEVRFVGIDHNGDFLRRAGELKDAFALKNVDLRKAFFDSDYDSRPYDLVLTRFTLQHASSPEAFLKQVFKRLHEGSVFITIDEYLFQTEMDDPVWNEFYDCWIRCFEEAGCDHLLPSKMNPWLEQAGFKDIENAVQLYSPITIGFDHFQTLVTRIASLLFKVYPHVWRKDFFPEFEARLERIETTHESDPFIPIAHTMAKKEGAL